MFITVKIFDEYLHILIDISMEKFKIKNKWASFLTFYCVPFSAAQNNNTKLFLIDSAVSFKEPCAAAEKPRIYNSSK